MNFQSLRRFNLLVMHPDPILCAGLVAALRQHATFEVFVHGVDHLGVDGPHVDVVIADYANAMQLTDIGVRRQLGVQGDARVLALTPNDREADIRRAIESGVYGYLLVGGPLDELMAGVKAVANGLRYMSVSVAQRMADSLTRASLTSREVEVLRLVATGQPNKSIARELSIELGTVKSHVSAIMTKLGASSRTQAARIAAARGLVEDTVDTEGESMPVSLRVRSTEPRPQYA
jgi:DNA-binding NarL/FixJ family response regulator